jgi:hypothetical protein
MLGQERIFIDDALADHVLDITTWPKGVYVVQAGNLGAVQLIKGR